MPIKDDLLNPSRRNPLAVPFVVVALFLLVGAAFLLGRSSVRGDAEVRDAAPLAESESVGHDAQGGGGAGAEVAEADPALDEVAEDLPADGSIPGSGGIHAVSLQIDGSLAATLIKALGPEVGDPLSMVTSRLMVWWLDVARDLRPGDAFDLAYELPQGSEPVVHALRFRSGKLAKTMHAYRFQAPGADFGRYYDEGGKEVELRLEDSPIADYDQVTSLLKDGRRHKGVDFKAPVGTPVKMPWPGVVRRTNWNYRVNGGSMEIEDAKGRKILFLHLSEITKGIGPGTRVSKGQVIALSGNTGRSTAPHLHYQVMSSTGRVLDPFDLHRTIRVELPAGAHEDFRAAVATLSRILDGSGKTTATQAATD